VIAAAKGGHVEAIEALVEAGAETGVACTAGGSGGVDALMMACRYVWVEFTAVKSRN
jgi:hypothetical protein